MSKDVANLRSFESFLLVTYKKYLQILEHLSKIKPGQLIAKSKITDDDEREKLMINYIKLRNTSITSFCQLLMKHPHFNFRMNIL